VLSQRFDRMVAGRPTRPLGESSEAPLRPVCSRWVTIVVGKSAHPHSSDREEEGVLAVASYGSRSYGRTVFRRGNPRGATGADDPFSGGPAGVGLVLCFIQPAGEKKPCLIDWDCISFHQSIRCPRVLAFEEPLLNVIRQLKRMHRNFCSYGVLTQKHHIATVA
jgi:hypothetical protein